MYYFLGKIRKMFQILSAVIVIYHLLNLPGMLQEEKQKNFSPLCFMASFIFIKYYASRKILLDFTLVIIFLLCSVLVVNLLNVLVPI